MWTAENFLKVHPLAQNFFFMKKKNTMLRKIHFCLFWYQYVSKLIKMHGVNKFCLTGSHIVYIVNHFRPGSDIKSKSQKHVVKLSRWKLGSILINNQAFIVCV